MKKALFFYITGVMLMLQSCIERDLCYDHTHMRDVEIKFDWSLQPDATPSTMVAHFFTSDGKHYKRYEFTDRGGGKIRIESGAYMVLFHNGEMEWVRERGNSWDSYELYTLEEGLLDPMSRDMPAPPRPSISADEPVRYAAETIWGGSVESVEVEPGNAPAVITMTPEKATSRYSVEISDVSNLSENLDISAAISGMAESHSLSKRAPSGSLVTIPLGLDRPDDHTLTSQFVVFGHCPETPSEHILTVYTSEKIYYNFDVTDQVHDAPDPSDIHIKVKGITLPTVNSGLTPSVDEWDDIEDILIKLN